MKSTIFNTKLEDVVQLELNADGESSAAVSLNPSYVWTKFILTDDLPNENKQRIPKEEFSNLIKTGIFAPVKMKNGEINVNHEDALPLGVITNLKESANKVEGMAALWLKEREEDVLTIKDMVNKGNFPQLSWEIMYEDSASEENGISALKNTVLRAVTLVGMPAYAGRTPIFAAASKNNNSEETVDKLEELTSRVTELEELVKSKDVELASKATELETLKASLEELETLRTFKASIDKEKADLEKLAAIKAKFKAASLDKDEEYFEKNKETLMGLSDSTLEFMIQEMISFASTKKVKEEEASKNEVPNFTADETVDLSDPRKLSEALRKKLLVTK